MKQEYLTDSVSWQYVNAGANHVYAFRRNAWWRQGRPPYSRHYSVRSTYAECLAVPGKPMRRY